MYGAIIGDFAGSIYEYEQFKKTTPVIVDKIIDNKSFFSDDTILTVAIAAAILDDKNYDKYLRKYAEKFMSYVPDYVPYFDSIFSPGFSKWSKGSFQGASCGNGAMMRISPVGYLFNSEEEIIFNAKQATIPSHNTKEAIDSAIKISLMIFYLRNGLSKEEAFKKIGIAPSYTPFKKFNMTCHETLDNCLYALKISNGFNDAIFKVLEMGGDTDTNAAIVGSMAEALYGIEPLIIEKINKKLPQEFIKVLNAAYKRISAGVV